MMMHRPTRHRIIIIPIALEFMHILISATGRPMCLCVRILESLGHTANGKRTLNTF